MKLLLISDSGMNVNTGGFSQTLYNVFSFVLPGNFLLITSLQANKIAPASPPYHVRVVTYDLELLPHQKNRLGKFVNRLIDKFNYSLQQLNHFKKLRSAVKNFNADVVIVAPNGPEAVFVYHQLKTAFINKKVFPYFMDDWLYQSKLKWLGGNIHALVKELLATNTAWMMISKSLGNILAERYAIKPAAILAVHNPVNMYNVVLPEPVGQKNEYTIAYAGSLWQMHFDALLVIANAIKMLKSRVKIKLVIYTGQNNWDWRKAELCPLEVEYGGHIQYAQIHATLAKADCLLVTSSFTKEWQTHTKASVQTKITDYLKAGRLIISCGPAYGANNQFLQQYNCGVCIQTNNKELAEQELYNIVKDLGRYQEYVSRGYEILKTHFSFEVVHSTVMQFLTDNQHAGE